MSEQESGQVSEQEKEAIEILETLSCYGLGLVITDENIQAIDIVLDYIDKLQKENKEKDKTVSKDKIKKLKEKIHSKLDTNGITRAYQIIIDKYFDELLEGETDE